MSWFNSVFVQRVEYLHHFPFGQIWFLIFCKKNSHSILFLGPPQSFALHWVLCKSSILIIWAIVQILWRRKENRTQDFQFLQKCSLKIFQKCSLKIFNVGLVLVLRSSDQVEKYVRNSGDFSYIFQPKDQKISVLSLSRVDWLFVESLNLLVS